MFSEIVTNSYGESQSRTNESRLKKKAKIENAWAFM